MPYYLRNGMSSHRHPFQGCGACNGVGAVDPVTGMTIPDPPAPPTTPQPDVQGVLRAAMIGSVLTWGAAGLGAYLGYRKSTGWAIAGGVGGYLLGGTLAGLLIVSSAV